MTFFTDIGSGEKAVQGVFYTDDTYTSAILVQAYQRVNVGIAIGSRLSIILSLWNFGGSVASGAAISGIIETASMSITLQRQYPEQMGMGFWHDVDAWSVTVAEGEEASSENISDKSEPEVVMYRIGVKSGQWESGLALVRLGTS